MRAQSRKDWFFLFFWMFLIGVAQVQLQARFQWPFPPLNTLVLSEHYSTDLGIVSMGAHRLATDVGYVQFLQYYGVPSHGEDPADHHGESEQDHEHEGHFHDYAGGVYPLLFEFGRRMLRLDPYFNAGILEVGGALAYNQKRIDEALSLLREAYELDPRYFRYQMYIAAILYRDEGHDESFVKALTDIMHYPDCPLLLKNILANLFVKQGRLLEAARVRWHIIQTASVEADRSHSERKLAILLQEHPELANQLQ